MQTFNPGANWKEEFEADPRDYIVEALFELPEKYVGLPDSVNLLDGVEETYNQNCVPSCTALGLTHTLLIQNVLDFKSSKIFLDWKDQWSNQGKKISCSAETGDYLEHALDVCYKNGIKGTGPTGKEIVYKIDGYAYQRFQSTPYGIDTIRFLLTKGKPLYTSFKGTRITWVEMSNGEVKNIINPTTATGGHAVAISGIDKDFIYFVNSWNPNKGKLSTFQMSYDNFKKAIDIGMINWRYWITYDKKDCVGEQLFKDYIKEPGSEEYDAVKFMRDKGYIKGSNGRLLPNEPVTRLQMCLIFYRLFNDLSNSSKK